MLEEFERSRPIPGQNQPELGKIRKHRPDSARVLHPCFGMMIEQRSVEAEQAPLKEPQGAKTPTERGLCLRQSLYTFDQFRSARIRPHSGVFDRVCPDVVSRPAFQELALPWFRNAC